MYNVISNSLNNIKAHNLKIQFICYANDIAICIVGMKSTKYCN